MPDFLASRVAWLHQFSEQYLTELVQVRQGGTTVPDVPMTVAREQNESESDFGSVIINSRRQDFLVSPDELTVAGLEKLERGDVIIRTISGVEIEYEVCGDGEDGASRWMSRYRGRWRVHTNRMEETILP